MGVEKLPTRANGQAIDENWYNIFKRVLAGVLVPRNSSGDPEDEAGDLGSSTHKWTRAHVTSGYHFCGELKYKYDFNGTVTIEQGWMLCDGRVISEANYNTEHGAGSWDLYIGTSPLDGKRLPTSNDIYLMGTTGATQSGSVALTRVGNASNNMPSLSHNHGGANETTDPDPPAISGTRPLDFGGSGAQSERHHTHTYTVPSNLTSTFKVQPESIQAKLYMRII